MASIFNEIIDQEIKRNDNDCKIVTIEGIDGSGKTTIVDAVIKKLQDKGYRASHFVTASNYNVFWNVVEDMQKQDIIDNHINQILHNLTFITYLKTEFINLLNNNDFIVSEWYIYGKLVLSELYEKDTKSKQIIESYMNSNQLIFPDYSFFLSVSVEVANYRINNRPGRKESKESLQMLRDAMLLWQNYLNRYDIEILDGTKTPDEISNTIVRRIVK